MIEERNKVGNCPLKINIVFPKRVIGIDEQCLEAIVSGHAFIITASQSKSGV
jgi:hypothetical protein